MACTPFDSALRDFSVTSILSLPAFSKSSNVLIIIRPFRPALRAPLAARPRLMRDRHEADILHRTICQGGLLRCNKEGNFGEFALTSCKPRSPSVGNCGAAGTPRIGPLGPVTRRS